MSKPKLPKVWVVFEEEEDGSNTPVSVRFYRTPDAVKYAPVQKPKVCVWTEDKNIEVRPMFDTECGEFDRISFGFKYCPYCGGKIKVAK